MRRQFLQQLNSAGGQVTLEVKLTQVKLESDARGEIVAVISNTAYKRGKRQVARK
jgi:hypothetical protein